MSEICDLCGGSGVNLHHRLWPDYPPVCSACRGSGRLTPDALPVFTCGGVGVNYSVSPDGRIRFA